MFLHTGQINQTPIKNTQKFLTENDLPPLSPQVTMVRHFLKRQTPVLFSNPHTHKQKKRKQLQVIQPPYPLHHLSGGAAASDLTPLRQIPSYVIPGSADMKGT